MPDTVAISLFPQELVTFDLVARYVLWVFLASCGVIQVASAVGGIKGILFFDSSRASAFFGTFLILVGSLSFLVWYSGLDTAHRRGLEGTEQAILFLPATAAAVLFCYIASSLIHRRRNRRRDAARLAQARDELTAQQLRGLEALKELSYLDVVEVERSSRS